MSISFQGKVISGAGQMKPRIIKYSQEFKDATGEILHAGTINVDVSSSIVGGFISIKEHFRIQGLRINDPLQDFLFEVCRINGFWAYRIRPYVLLNGLGGHGDHILEIACSQNVPNCSIGSTVTIELFR